MVSTSSFTIFNFAQFFAVSFSDQFILFFLSYFPIMGLSWLLINFAVGFWMFIRFDLRDQLRDLKLMLGT